MTDYWKSQDRKYCDFCKCWITDNKPSVQFHENGKRHKENVAKKISELTKKSTKAQKESKKLDEEMKKMEEAALKAYMKDIESNPDFTSQQYKQIQEEKAAAQQEEVKGLVKKIKKEALEAPVKETPVKEKPSKKKLWHEAKSDQGHTYYWNVETNESVWEAPKEGYVSIEEQKKKEEAAARLQEVQEAIEKDTATFRAKEVSEEIRAFCAREEMKKYRKEEVKEVEDNSCPVIGPAPKIDPYGTWTTIETEILPPVDLQLPQAPRPIEVPQVVINEPQIKIKEKKINYNLDDHDSNSAPVFKKRKPNRGNMRQRLDDD